MYPDNQSIMNAVGGMGQPSGPQTASNSMNQTVNPGQDTPGAAFGGGMGMSPVNNNPNYAQTIMDFFNYNPIAGPAPFQNNPLQQGMAGNNASVGNAGWNSFQPNDPHTMMQNIMQLLGGM